MAYIQESFNTSEERNMRWKELKEEHYDVVCYSDVPLDAYLNETEDKTIKYIVAYPVNERLYE